MRGALVAEVLLNPLGEDDDDFECNFLIDKNIALLFRIYAKRQLLSREKQVPFSVRRGKKETHIGLGNLEEEDEVDLSIGKEKVTAISFADDLEHSKRK
ncbi:unnamed protein product [Heligmosomoides polygyrus]|uniref:Bestrophin homolog n=1 Tax=Heligmosomoides polygyrus TaxID=6339 RepID=A0A183GMV9_HELPZ|nr:unnamed protein product [Heligmosomoides polygyrus]